MPVPAAVSTTPVALRKMTHSLVFDGVDDYVHSNTPFNLKADTPHTVAMWFMITDTTSSGRLFSNYFSASEQFSFGLRASSGLIEGAFYTGSGYKGTLRTSQKIEANVRYHLIWSYDGSEAVDGTGGKIYINGRHSNGGSSNIGGALGSAGWTIGQRNDLIGDSVLKGSVDDVQVIEGVGLSDEQALQLFLDNVLPNGATNKYFNSPSTDGAGTVLTDSIGTNHGTISGATWSTDTPYKEPVSLPTRMPHVLKYASGNVTTITHNSSLALGGTTPFAIDIEVEPTSNTTVQRIFAQALEILIRTTVSGTYEFIVNSLSTIDRVQAGTNIPNKLTRLLCQYTGTKLQIFQDGVLVGEVSPTGTYATLTDDYTFGIGSGETFAGRQKAPKIWVNTSLTPTEVYNLHQHNKIPEEGLVGNWDEISDDGTTLINSADPTGATDGTITGAVRETNIGSLGKTPPRALVPYVGSVAGTGINQYVNIYSASFESGFNNAEGTFHFNFYVPSGVIGNGAQQYLFQVRTDVSNTVRLSKETTEVFRFQYVAGGTNRAVDVNARGYSSGWHKATLVYSKSNDVLSAYINGIPVGRTTSLGTWAGALDTLQCCIFGATTYASSVNWKGNLATAKYYNRALTTAEVEQLYLTNITPWDNTEHCVLNLETLADRIDGTTWIDASPAGNNGTLSGATFVEGIAPSHAPQAII